ncbi:MAG: polysaccharide biosynthesis/export family protein [Chitinophagaceae bacterium]
MNIAIKILSFVLLLHLASCINTRPIQYVQGQFDTAQLSQIDIKEPVIQRADLISIVVFSDNVEATAIYNQPNSAGGYLVDEKGNIQMQGVGDFHVEGLTKSQLTDSLNSKLQEFLKNPYYTIRFVNYKITLVGELTREGVYTVPNEKVNIFEAIGLAGGLTVYARRENVMVIREVNGKREFARLDLTNPDIFNSPYYFLKQNDLIFVEQTRNKLANIDQTVARTISLATTVISTLIFLYTVFK